MNLSWWFCIGNWKVSTNSKSVGRRTTVRQPGFLPFWQQFQTKMNDCHHNFAIVDNRIGNILLLLLLFVSQTGFCCDSSVVDFFLCTRRQGCLDLRRSASVSDAPSTMPHRESFCDRLSSLPNALPNMSKKILIDRIAVWWRRRNEDVGWNEHTTKAKKEPSSESRSGSESFIVVVVG
jgi:hypothetical protein